MMRLPFFILYFVILFSAYANAGARLEVSGGYSYANLQYSGASGSGFSMLSDKGYFGAAEAGIGTKYIELFAEGMMSFDRYLAPTSRTLQNPSLSRMDVSGGIRGMIPNFAASLKFAQRSAVLLNDLGNNVYDLSTVSPSMLVGGLQFSAREKLISIIVNLEAGYPLASAPDSNGVDTKISQFMNASAKINVGNVWRVSLFGGVKNMAYKSDDKYTTFDIYAGLMFSSSLSFSSKSSSSGESIPWIYSGPNYSSR